MVNRTFQNSLQNQEMDHKFLIVIGGATATGKTAVAIEVAKHFKTEIISADSRQFYREMSVGTAKPDQRELAVVKHHFIDSLCIDEHYSVGHFERQAIEKLIELFEELDMVVMAGGSGLFIQAVCQGLDTFPEVPLRIAENLKSLFAEKGIEWLQKELKEKDPDYYHEVDLQNPQRLLRALGVCEASGKPFTSFRNHQKVKRDFIPIYLLLERERTELYSRINDRVDDMIEKGLVEEARSLYKFRKLNSLQTVGYQELFKHFDGELTLQEAIDKIKQNTRR